MLPTFLCKRVEVPSCNITYFLVRVAQHDGHVWGGTAARFTPLLCRGVIQLRNETYVLEPLPQSATNQHVLYLLTDVQSDPATCGVVGEATAPPGSDHQPLEPGRSLTSLLRVCVLASVIGRPDVC